MRAAVLNIGVSVLMMAGGAMAVDLKNEDSKRYELKIHEGAATTSSSIEGGTTRACVCSECTIEVGGVGSIDAAGDQVVMIKDGKLSIAE